MSEAVARITSASKDGKGEAAFLSALKDFCWKDQYQSRFERGEFSHWLDLFNFFDEWLEKHVACHELTLNWESEGSEESFPVETCLEVLRVSRTILENCTSKHAYGSLDHLAHLLSAPQPEVVFATLSTLVTLTRRSLFQSTARWHHGNTELSSRIFSLAQGWGGIKAYSSMVSCIETREDETMAATSSSSDKGPYDLHFEFFREEECKGKPKGHQVIHLKGSDPQLSQGTNLEVCERLTTEYGVPLKLRFALLNRIRIIRSLREGIAKRVDSVRMRLIAFHILFQSSPDHEDLPLLLNEPGLVQDLLDVLYNQQRDCYDLKNLAARALASMCCDRSRQQLFLRTVNNGQEKEKFVLFLKSAIENASTGSHLGNKLLESLLSLVSVLSVSTLGCAILSQLGLVQILLDLMQVYPGPQLQIVSGAVRILEALVERDSSVMRSFREFHGLKVMVTRLQRELGLLEKDTEMEDCDKSAKEAGVSPGTGKVLAKRFLVKSLLRAIALTCYTNGEWTQSRLTFEGESSALPLCLEAIFRQAKDLGSSVFALAATVMGDLLHHDPTCFPIIQKHGLPQAFLGTVQNGILITPDTVCCLPTTLVALCLNKKGLKDVQASKILNCLVSIFTSPQHCRALQGDTPSMLGNGLDELVRHVPEMKETCIDVLFAIINKVMEIGSKLRNEQLGSQAKATKGEEDSGRGAEATTQPMETDGSPTTTEDPSPPSTSSSQTSASDVYYESMSEIVSNAARLLEAMLANPSVGDAFVKRGGVQLLLGFYSIPVKNPSPNTIHQLFSAFRVLNPSHSKQIARSLIHELETLLETIESQNKISKICSFMLEDHLSKPNEEASGIKDRPVLKQNLHALEGLFSLSGNLLRSSSLVLNGFSLDSSAKLLGLLGSFQSSMIWYSCLFEEVKEHHNSKNKAEGDSASPDAPSTSGGKESDKKAEGGSSSGSKSADGKASKDSQKKKSKHEPFLDIVNRVLVSVRQLFQVLARNLQNDRSARGSVGQRKKEAFNLAASLARLSLDYFNFSERSNDSLNLEKLVIGAGKTIAEDHSQSLIRRAKLAFVSQALEETSNLLSDQRRKTCNSLLVNAFVRGSVLKKTLGCLQDHVEMLGCASADDLEKASVIKVVSKVLTFLGNLLNPSMLLTNTQALLYVAFPKDLIKSVFEGRDITEVDLPGDADQFLMMIQQEILEQVTKVWKFGLKHTLPQEVISALLVIFHNAAQEGKTKAVRTAVKEKKFVPCERIIEQILNMGFTRKQAENALNKVKLNNLEVAMEWLLSHPDESGEDDELARALAMSMEPKDSTKAGSPKEDKPLSIQEMRQLHVPSIEEFLHVFFNCLEEEKKEDMFTIYTNSFALVEVLRCVCFDKDQLQEKATVNTERALTFLATATVTTAPGGANSKAKSAELHTFVALHLLLLLACKDESVRCLALKKKVVSSCVDLLRSDSLKNQPVQRWVSPLLLLLDCYLKMLWNPEKLAFAGGAEGGFNAMAASLLQGEKDGAVEDEDRRLLKEAFDELKDGNLQLEVAKCAYGTLDLVCKGAKDNEATFDDALRRELVLACLQVMGTICRDHEIAMKLYKMGILDTLLNIPLECRFPPTAAIDTSVFSILKYIVEDPVTLQSAMEAQIRAVFRNTPKFWDLRAESSVFARAELKSICKSFVPFYSRDKDIFKAAISSVCEIDKSNGKVMLVYPSSKIGLNLEHKSQPSLGGEVEGSLAPKEGSRKSARSSRAKGQSNNGKSGSSKATAFPSVVRVLLNTVMSNSKIMIEEGWDAKKGDESVKDDEAAKKCLSWLQKSISLCLSILTDFCIHYSACVHHVLQVDSGTSVLNFIIDNLLPTKKAAVSGLTSSYDQAIMSNNSSCFLVAVCTRSSEARKRVIQHVVSNLMALPSHTDADYEPMDVSTLQATVDFIHALLSASNASQTTRTRFEDKSRSRDVIKDMREMRVTEGLVCAIDNVDLHNPGVPRILNSILKPLNIILESLNKSALAALSAKVEGSGKKESAGAARGGANQSGAPAGGNNGTSAQDLNRADGEDIPRGSLGVDRDHGLGSRLFQDVQYHSLNDTNMDDMESGSEDEDDRSGDDMDSDSELSSSLSATSSSLSVSDSDSLSHSRSTSYPGHESSEDIEPADNHNEDFQVVVSGVNGEGGGRQVVSQEVRNGQDMDNIVSMINGERSLSPLPFGRSVGRTVLRVSEVDMDTDSQSSSLASEERAQAMLEDDEADYVFHEREENSEEEWLDSPVIEVRVRSPFQMRYNNGAMGARESVGLQTGIPLLDNFFGALGVADDMIQSLAPRRIGGSHLGTSRGPRPPGSMAGVHPLYNPYYNPTLSFANAGGARRSQDSGSHNQYSRLIPGPMGGQFSSTPSGFWQTFEAEAATAMFANPRTRVHQRLANLADTFGLGTSWNIWQAEDQSSGFEIFSSGSDGNPNSRHLHPLPGPYGRRDMPESSRQNAQSASESMEKNIESLVLSSVPLKKASPAPVDPKKTDTKKTETKDQGASKAAKPRAAKEDKPALQEVGGGASDQPREGGDGSAGTSVPAPAPTTELPSGENPPGRTTEAAGGTEASPSAAQAANPSIDPAFLEALPEELREEVLAQGTNRQTERRPAGGVPDLVTAQESALDLDPEFLAALPPDIQSEVLAQQRSARNIRAREATASGAEMDLASIIATFPADVREEVLMSLNMSTLATLPPEILAEAQTARDRVNSRSFQTYAFGQDNTYSAVTQRNGGGNGGQTVGRTSLQGRLLLAHGGDNSAPGCKRGSFANKWATKREVLSEAQPPISAAGVASIVRLLRVSSPLGKGLMHRVLMNICGHPESCRSLLTCFSDILGYAMQEADPGATSSSGGKPEGLYSLYGCQGDAHYAQKSSYKIPMLFLQRILGLLSYLIKHDFDMSFILLTWERRKPKEGGKDRKGKAAVGSSRGSSRDKNATTIVKQLYALLSTEFEKNGGMFDVVLQLVEGILSDINKLVTMRQEEEARLKLEEKKEEESRKKEKKEDKEEDEARAQKKVADKRSTVVAKCQSALESFSGAYLESLPKFLSANVERTSSDHLQNIMSYMCTILPKGNTQKMISALLVEGSKVVSQCKLEISQEISDKESVFLSIKSGFVLLKVASKIEHLEAQERKRHKDFDLRSLADFVTFQDSAQALWLLLERHAGTLETGLKKLAPKVGDVPIAPQSILPYFPIIECFAILSTIAERPAGDEAKGKKGGHSGAAEDKGKESGGALSFVSFAEKHSLLVNSLIKHDPGCLEENFKILLKQPRLIEFENKCSYFKGKIGRKSDDHHHHSLRLCVRRDCVFEDSFHQLRHRTKEEMHGRLNVQFQGEDGVDAGGLTREWYQVMSRAIFKEELALFTSGGNGTTFQPNPNSMIQNEGVDHLQYFKFVGRFVAKALVDGQILDAYFTRSLYKHLLGEPLSYEDIEAVDPDYFKNLKWMLENDIENVLDLTFTAETDYFDKKTVVDLKPEGAKIAVTNENKAEYVNLIAKHRMTNAIQAQISAFLEGFWELVDKTLLEIFNDKELELLISGLPEIDIFDLKANTEYVGYFPNSPVVRWFWEILVELSKEDKARLLQFCTGTSKVPLEGFKALQGVSGPQKFQIHKSYGAKTLLPTAHTCFNQLDLVEYDSKEQLKERLQLAIKEGLGFGFV